jgi:CRISPR-associated endoribonuclease Cas6
MRLYLKLTRNKEIIPFNYQHFLTGAIHKWIGQNNSVHDELSLYSFSWFQNAEAKSNSGIKLTNSSYFFISAYDESLLKKLIKGIMDDPSLSFGVYITDIQIVKEPEFSSREVFPVASPVFIKRRFDDEEKHITYNDIQSSRYLTETLRKKLKAANLLTNNVRVSFDTNYSAPRTKIINYKEIRNRVNICPILIEGTPEQIAFAWNVGVGNSTGIGFGALK